MCKGHIAYMNKFLLLDLYNNSTSGVQHMEKKNMLSYDLAIDPTMTRKLLLSKTKGNDPSNSE